MAPRQQANPTGTSDTEFPVGVEERRPGRLRLRYELLGCGLRGHRLTDPAAAAASGHQDLLIFADGRHPRVTWHRCLRCDAWLPLDRPVPTRDTSRDPGDPVQLPLRGRPLRDRFVLRLIAVDRIIHFLLIGAVAVAIFLFAKNRQRLEGDYTRVLNRLQAAVGGP